MGRGSCYTSAPAESGGPESLWKALIMASKFQQFLADNKIDPRRVLVASRRLERLMPEDRLLRLQKRQGAKAEGGEKITTKPRSGRPVTQRLLDRAVAGGPITGSAKTRLLRAVNRVLEQKKKAATELRSLF